jgi:hypothetical protein
MKVRRYQNGFDQAPTRFIRSRSSYSAEGRKALVGPESDLAAAAAYKPPSMWSALLSGLGSIGVAAGAKGGSFAGFNYPSDFVPDLTGEDVSLADAAKEGVKSGLKMNNWMGTVW